MERRKKRGGKGKEEDKKQGRDERTRKGIEESKGANCMGRLEQKGSTDSIGERVREVRSEEWKCTEGEQGKIGSIFKLDRYIMSQLWAEHQNHQKFNSGGPRAQPVADQGQNLARVNP